MKHVVSISLGSSRRNHAVEVEFLGEKFLVERIGTDGNMEEAIRTIKKLDGQVDAFGLGGIDLYLWVGPQAYEIKDARRIANAAQKTPIVDGSGLKNTLERRVIKQLAKKGIIDGENRKVLLVCGVDRFGMAEELAQLGCQVIFGDLIFGLGLPVPLYSLTALQRVAKLVAPVACRLPFQYLYPVGAKQEKIDPRFHKYYMTSDIIAGDYHFIHKHLPPRLEDKIILTNTVTESDVENLTQRGVKLLITTTPEFSGRSFGTNLMEALLVALDGKKQKVTPQGYDRLLEELHFEPRIEDLQLRSQKQSMHGRS